MKKLLTCFLSIVMLLTLVCSLSACSTNDIKIEYHIDNFTLDISVPEGTLPENYQEEINKNDFLLESSGSILSSLVSISGFSRALLDGIGGALSEKQIKYLKN